VLGRSRSETLVRSILLTALAAAGCAWIATAAQENVEVGLVACTLSEPTDTETDGSASGSTARQVLCAFKLKSGAEETYVGKVQVMNLSATEKVTLVWRVKVAPSTRAAPGFLEQAYVPNPTTPADQIPDLVGQANSRIILQSMADKKEGSASAKEKSPADGVAVLGMELKLKSTTG
jgi:Protein of unknown function (DUF992)